MFLNSVYGISHNLSFLDGRSHRFSFKNPKMPKTCLNQLIQISLFKDQGPDSKL